MVEVIDGVLVFVAVIEGVLVLVGVCVAVTVSVGVMPVVYIDDVISQSGQSFIKVGVTVGV